MMPTIRILVNPEEKEGLTEDQKLAALMRALGHWNAQTLDIRDAVKQTYLDSRLYGDGEKPIYLFRNVYPASDFKDTVVELQKAADFNNIQIFVTPRRNGRIMEDKSYLREQVKGHPNVLSTWFGDEAGPLPRANKGQYIVKPVSGSSAIGVYFADAAQVKEKRAKGDLQGHIVQRRLDLQDERSIYFVDSNFIYATKTRDGTSLDPDQRWDMVEYEPSAKEMKLAREFERFCTRSPGQVVRIDFGTDQKGKQWLMELEDLSPHLSFDCVSEESAVKMTKAIMTSIERGRALIMKNGRKPIGSLPSAFGL